VECFSLLSDASLLLFPDSETYDLAGKGVSTIETVVRDAFTEAFPLSETIRITLVTGAGKLARQKYDEGAAKAVTSTLRELEYVEDQSGGAGTFKLQHDTGKNLKTVVIYPRVSQKGANDIVGGTADLSLGGQAQSLLHEDSIEYKVAYASKKLFENMVNSECPSWSQKKGLVATLDDLKAKVDELDKKLLSGTPLSDSEQTFYDSVSSRSLDEKQNYVKDLMHKHVEEGRITSDEKKQILSQVNEKLESLNKEMNEAEEAKKPKRVENLKALIAKSEERKEKIEKMNPHAPHRLQHESKINTLRKELTPLLELEDRSKGRLLTLKESQSLARKEEILDEIEKLKVSVTFYKYKFGSWRLSNRSYAD
jgi:hypothetical protein